jgi:Patatin phospholipase
MKRHSAKARKYQWESDSDNLSYGIRCRICCYVNDVIDVQFWALAARRGHIKEIMQNIEPEPYERLRQIPRFIQLIADAAPTTITRIVNEIPEGELPFLDNDFSLRTNEGHKKAGYESARPALCGTLLAATGTAS